mgnify:CR=1 FL=1
MKYFTLQEFDSPDKPGSGKNMDKDFLEMIDCAREEALINVGFTRLGISATFIHADNDPDKADAIWLY